MIRRSRTTGDALTPSGPPQSPPAIQQPERPAQVRLYDLLGASRRLTVAAAESCTGGEVAHRVTAVAGSSAYFQGSIVSYSNEAKATLLGVPREMLANPGAVSEACARAMAEGARRAFGADTAVATTGIAGPDGGTARKPVGLVYIAASGPAGTVVEEHHFPGDRTAVIDAAATAALRLLVDTVEAVIEASGVRHRASEETQAPPDG